MIKQVKKRALKHHRGSNNRKQLLPLRLAERREEVGCIIIWKGRRKPGLRLFGGGTEDHRGEILCSAGTDPGREESAQLGLVSLKG